MNWIFQEIERTEGGCGGDCRPDRPVLRVLKPGDLLVAVPALLGISVQEVLEAVRGLGHL